MKPTLILGASSKPDRYAYKATSLLKKMGYPVIPVGTNKGSIEGTEILNTLPIDPEVDTVTMYLNKTNQKQYYDFILDIKPRRIIFNPGAENPELEVLAKEKGISTENACTLVLLHTGQY